MSLEKNQYNQAKCPHCGSWHFAITLNDNYVASGEAKCCKCQRFFNILEGIEIEIPTELKTIENKNKGKLI